MGERPQRWVLLGYYGGRNSGDNAMLEAFIGELPPAMIPNLTILAKDVELSPAVLNCGARIDKATPLAIARVVTSIDGLIQAGGTIFHDQIPAGQYAAYLVKLVKLALVLWAVRIAGGRVAMVGVGLGPLHRWPSRLVTAWALRACTVVTTRDQPSFDTARSLVPSSGAVQSNDLAILIAGRLAGQKRPTGRRILSIAPIGLGQVLDGEGDADERLWGRVSEALVQVMDEAGDLDVRVVQMSDSSGMTNDGAICREIVQRIAARHPTRVAMVPYDNDPTRCIEAFAQSDAVIAARYHGAVFGYVARAPLLVVGYHRKVFDFADHVGLGRRARIIPDQPPETAPMVLLIKGLLAGERDFVPALPVETAWRQSRLNVEALRPLGLPAGTRSRPLETGDV